MIAPFYNRYRMAWPFQGPYNPDTFDTIDTSVEHPPWHVAGHWKTPPPKVCDLLTASNFELKFTFDHDLFNAQYNTIMPYVGSDVTYGNSGTWREVFNFVPTMFNDDYKWDTTRKVFERFIDPDTPLLYPTEGFKGHRTILNLDVYDISDNLERTYSLDVTMYAQIPYPAKDQDGEFIWTVNNLIEVIIGESIYRFADGTTPPSPIHYDYYLNVGSRYLGIDHLGPQGHGANGCVPVAEISILSHF